jgi:hypothetical protein
MNPVEVASASALAEALERERLRIQREMNAYPTPIAGCDAYFNHLLEKRAAVCDELAKLRSRGEPASSAGR